MKKSSMRVACLLMALVLMTSCFVGGTFARYITKDSGEDSARVAKFGVTASVTGSLFGAHYYNNESGNKISASYKGSVDSATTDAGDSIVAPGTKNEDGVTISITGTPEVEVSVNVASTTSNDIYLNKGVYGVMVSVKDVTESNVTEYYVRDDDTHKYTKATLDDYKNGVTKYYKLKDTVTNESKYLPINYSLNNNGTVVPCTSIEEVLNTIGVNETNNSMSLKKLERVVDHWGIKTITWEWPFRGTDAAEHTTASGCDTILGDLIAYDTEAATRYEVVVDNLGTYTGVQLDVADGVTYAKTYNGTQDDRVACLTAGFDISVSVVQVD